MGSLGERVVKSIAGAIRKAGAQLDSVGAKLEVAKYTEKLVPSTRFVAVDGVVPLVSQYGTFVAPSSSVIGDVTIGRNSSVWYGATVRGDVNNIKIGERTNIMDHALIHVSRIQGDAATEIGNNVTVSAGAVVHGAILKDLCLVGESAQILDNAVVESNSIVDAGAVVTPGTVVPGGELWAGSPARKVRDLTPEEISTIPQIARDNTELAAVHILEHAKGFKTILEEEDWIDFLDGEPDDDRHVDENEWKTSVGPAEMGLAGEIFNSSLMNPVEGLKHKLEKEKKAKEKAQRGDS